MVPNDEKLRSIKTFPSLVKYLRDELDWPIDSDDVDDLTFEYQAEELGLDPKTAVKIKEIKQLRPLKDSQPWGIFFVNFEPKRLPVVVLRRILQALAIKRRPSANKAQQQAWHPHDLLFISSYGETEHRDLSFAHFSENPETSELPTLKVLGWDDEDTVLHLEHAHKTLKEKLHWPQDTNDISAWRQSWSSAFTLRHREVINTSKAMAVRLAQLATAIRKRVNRILAVESESGPLRKLHIAFQEALIHALSPDDFADMYAQTITYGLLSARVSRPADLIADNIKDMVPVTNPFLRELLSTFLIVGGRKGKIDFDEVGINDVVQTLRDADMEAVLRDFGDRNPQEDPVVHFYELFLKEYDPKKKMQRGVFYTPRPVVSYIVRSVHELLQKEFGLKDGLADTATWGDMLRRHPSLTPPTVKVKKPNSPDSVETPIDPNTPFVQILDPACGTGTFLVEVIDIIDKTMKAKWRKEGQMEFDIPRFWNEYVADYLLPRLYGYELMMAPYAVAHMKIGIKLFETGYRFASEERARIYLTNSLEPPQDFSDRLAFDSPALAHEAHAVNAVKRNQRFTVIVGNPPYSGISSNMSMYAQQLVDVYKIVDGQAMNERKLWLQDDYVKFIRLAQIICEDAHYGIIGYITNHGYLNNPTFRGMRQNLSNSFDFIQLLDLHGNANKKECSPDGSKDENVFDIKQGVAICLAARTNSKANNSIKKMGSCDMWGERENKYVWLAKHTIRDTEYQQILPISPFYFFVLQDTNRRNEYDSGWSLTNIFTRHGVGMVTARDALTTDFDANCLWKRVQQFALLPPEQARKEYDLGEDVQSWKVRWAQEDIRKSGPKRQLIRSILYRPFDIRYIYYTGKSSGFICRPVYEIMRHMQSGCNYALISARSNKSTDMDHFFATRLMMETKCGERTTQSCIFPLHLQFEDNTLVNTSQRTNISGAFIAELQKNLNLTLIEDGVGDLKQTIGPEIPFFYIYAVLHSPSYRNRYAEFLKNDFPRVPLTSSLDLFRSLAKHGGELISLHLMESDKLNKHITKWLGPTPSSEVEKVIWSDDTVWINKSKTEGFKGVTENVWNFHIGGYQVCEKWLKDRKGRILSAEDIEHYQKIVVALSETIKIMAEIDKTIDAHGGWPGAFMNKK
jgi:hypothetical protein